MFGVQSHLPSLNQISLTIFVYYSNRRLILRKSVGEPLPVRPSCLRAPKTSWTKKEKSVCECIREPSKRHSELRISEESQIKKNRSPKWDSLQLLIAQRDPKPAYLAASKWLDQLVKKRQLFDSLISRDCERSLCCGPLGRQKFRAVFQNWPTFSPTSRTI